MDETPRSFLVDKHVFSTGFSAILNYLRVYETWSANSGYFFMHKPPMSHVSLEELGGPHQFLNGAFAAWACHCWDRLILRVVEGSKSNGQSQPPLVVLGLSSTMQRIHYKMWPAPVVVPRNSNP